MCWLYSVVWSATHLTILISSFGLYVLEAVSTQRICLRNVITIHLRDNMM